MAYTLGFWFADGYMRRDRSYRIIFYSGDKEILEKIKSAMGSEHLILRWGDRGAWQLSIYSKGMYEQLSKIGGHRRKSKSLKFPNIPRSYLRDFIRGHFDGDGSVFYVAYKASKNGKKYRELRSSFTSGSGGFLTELGTVLNREIGLAKKILGKYNNGGSFKLGYGTEDTKKLLSYMYYPKHEISLQRKARFCYDLE